jgi:hypothetical protein
VFVLLLAWPASRGQGSPGDDKKPQPPRERFDALVKEHADQQRQIIADLDKAEPADRQKLIQKYNALRNEFAEKVYQVAEDNPKDPVAADALFWVLQNGVGSSVYQKAVDKAATLVAEMPLKDLTERLATVRTNAPLIEAVFKRAEKEEKDPRAGDLLAWIVSNSPAGIQTADRSQKAAERLIEKYPDHAAIRTVCRALARTPMGEETLKQLLEKDAKPRVKAAAALALGQTVAARAQRLPDDAAEKARAEADKYLARAVELAKDDAELRTAAERALYLLRNLKVGKEAPDIKAADLDGKEFKLSDYRGKVVLLDFWGNW